MLVEVDFKNDFKEKIMIKRKGHCSFSTLSIENLPDFYTHCGIVGQLWEIYRNQLFHEIGDSVKDK